MNHDYAHCADYNEDCPKTCFRGLLVRDLPNVPDYLPITWVHFDGTQYCKKRYGKKETNNTDKSQD